MRVVCITPAGCVIWFPGSAKPLTSGAAEPDLSVSFSSADGNEDESFGEPPLDDDDEPLAKTMPSLRMPNASVPLSSTMNSTLEDEESKKTGGDAGKTREKQGKPGQPLNRATRFFFVPVFFV